MLRTVSKRFACLVLVLLLLVGFFPVMNAHAAYTGSLSVAGLTAGAGDGDNGTWQGSGTTITGSAKTTAKSGCGGTITYTAQTGNLTLTNSSGEARVLTFDYALELNGGSASVDGAVVTANGSFSKKLENDESVAISITSSNAAENTTKITLSNLALEPEKEVEVAFAPAEHGSYTVDGTSISSATTLSKLSSESFALVATPASGYRFYCWYSNANNRILSMNATASLSFSQPDEVTAKFVPSTTPFFDVSGQVFIDLNEAVNYAVSNSKPTIILIADGTLPAGNYTIPAGKTLLIPFDAANTMYTTRPYSAGKNSSMTGQKAFRTLTLASGANITVNGALNVCAKHASAAGGSRTGGTTGPYGHVKMSAGSSIVVNNGAALYAYGYVSGTGTITANSGAKVHEYMQFADWMGGSITSNILGSNKKIFPFTQYYVQNIEATLILRSGATETVHSSLSGGGMDNYAEVDFFGTKGMFNTSGSLTKRYDVATDRLIIDVEGNSSVNSLSVSTSLVDVDSKDYTLPINSNITINIHSGTTTTNQDIALLPGAEINIDHGAAVKIGSGTVCYVYDVNEWGPFTFGGKRLINVGYTTAGTSKLRTDITTNAVVDVNGELIVDGSLYTTQTGASIISSQGTGVTKLNKAAPADSSTYQWNYSSSSAQTIPVTAAKLQNADGSYVETAGSAAGTEIPYVNGVWGGTAQTYTVTWKNEDGTVLETDENVAEGATPEYNGATPTKEGDAQYSYTFKEWSPAITAVTGDVTYTATYTQTTNTYTVKWLDEDGNVLETDASVPYGTTPEYNGATPTKEATASTTYSFSGWDPEVTAVTGDISYTAQFTEAARTYTVTWLAEDGQTVLATDEVAYGEKPVYNNGVDPVKEDTAQFDYEFAGWVNGNDTYASAALPVVTDDVAYKASFSETLRTYTVTWVNDDGTVLETDADAVYGSAPSYDGETPTKEATAQYSYTFAGWTPEVADVTGDVTYKATYSESTRTYTVTWKNADGTVLETDENVPYGTVPAYDGENPTKAGDAQYSYSFAGWDPTVTAVAGDATYTAQFTEVTNTYTVYWVNDDGTQLEVDENVAYGVTPEYNGETPTKAATAEFTYTFDSWTPAVSTVTGTITYTAVYTAVRNVYNITFVNEDGTVLDTQPVPYGETPVYAGETPTKAATAEYTYTFSGWTPEIAAVTGEATYTAAFSAEKNTYTVQFVNEDGTVLDEQTVAYGETPVFGGTAMPTKEATAEFTYTFSGWTPEIVAVTGDTTYTAKFDAETNKYAVKFVDEDGNVLDEQQVPYGEVPVYGGETPTKAETARWSYAFSGWTPELAAVTGEATYTAQFDATGKNGLCVEGEDTYWIENGENVPFPGLIRIVLDDGTVNYYYFGEDGKAVKDGTYKVEKNNGERLPAYNYNFGPDGVIEHDADTSKNGVCEGDGSVFYYIDGVKVGEGLVFIDGSYYYARTSTAEIVRDRMYYVSKTNGLPIAPGEYRFDADGKLMLNGFVDQDGKTYYYDNGTRLYGFNKIGEDYYFFNAANGSMYRSMKLWVGANDYGVEPGYYDFGADGRMVVAAKDGLVTEGGATYGYDNGTKLYGLAKIGEDYYFFNKSSGKMYKDAKMWVGENAYGFEPGYYDFDADGKMIVPGAKNGFVEENGATFYYVDGELAKGLTKIGDDYYFFNLSSGKLYRDRNLWVGANDYGFEGGMYYFDADGKMVP